ncbi:hypothetical protein L0666_02300 [Octadecabacter sp. CECT 8868]|uniref:hypothetical protein n=1 Tax=Octadecabacter algicola TaxID=2909342 RepID=UPI001F39F71B|nr:hypothetical protein [Octadecabacter algicola]MCF2903805.1 hypothetical protein [Octadecabacter algicola]
MRVALLALGVFLSGCAESSFTQGAPNAGEAPTGAQQAYFPSYPSTLFFAAGAACDGPGQSIVRPSRNEVRCESLPDPESAAAIILNFDGTVEELPKTVISFSGRETAQGYLVTADTYIRVPQRSGGSQLVRFPNEQVQQDMSELLRAAGGRPL